VFLDLTGCSELVERTLRHPRKDVDHWIKSVLLKGVTWYVQNVPQKRLTNVMFIFETQNNHLYFKLFQILHFLDNFRIHISPHT